LLSGLNLGEGGDTSLGRGTCMLRKFSSEWTRLLKIVRKI
jgi:hypothetical protein